MARPGDRLNSCLNKYGYTQIKKVGEGSFGAAILVQHSSDRDKGTQAIVKMIDISRASKQEKEDAVKESQVLSSLKHPYIVRYRESFHEDGWLCIVMDYCEGGDLSERIKKMRISGKLFSQEQILRWFTQSILALKYIHDMHILHRDLKSGNFFLSKSGNIKMGDFGIAKVLECTAACAQTQIGTPYYLSPEICQGKSYAWGSDIWSMGCILFEMCARKVPFDAPDLKTLIQRITKGPTPEIPSDYTSPLRNLVRELLDREASKRPPAAEVLKRPVVQEVVRKMLDEVKEEEAATGAPPAEPVREPVREAPRPVAASGSGKYAHCAGSYNKNEILEYWSETHKEWLPASVTAVDDNGRVQLNVKPNVWLSLEVQSQKVRPKQNPVSQAAAKPVVTEVQPAQVVEASEPRIHRVPSRGGLPPAGRAGPRQATPTREVGGARGASPRRDLASGGPGIPRGSSQDRAAGRRTPQRREGAGIPSRG